MEYKQAFQNMNLPPSRYATRYGAPMIFSGLIVGMAIYFWVGPLLPPAFAPLIPVVFVAFAVMVAALWPMVLSDRRKGEINNALPFFMTHFGVLSTSNLPRTEIFRLLGQKKEYKALAQDLEKIHSLVTNWNLSLPQACRIISKSTPSQIWSDFLERLAHAFETGQELEIFTRNEQSVVMKEYSTVYETSIYQIENWKDIYSSVMMSGVFFVIFAIITPVLSDMDPGKLLMGTLVFFFFMEILLMFVLRMRVPEDQLWHKLNIETEERKRIRLFVLGALALAVPLLVFLPMVSPLPLAMNLAVAFSPFAVPGFYANRVEGRIKRREDNYAAFIRSLGATAAARGGSLREVLKKVKYHNYGPLTGMVHNLYARLSWRLYDYEAWKRFSAESGSNLVEEFNDMFVEGIKSGGKPDVVGEIISDNVLRILNLRKSRYSQAGTFRGLLFGMTASMAFVLFVGVGILDVLGDLFTTTDPEVAKQNPLNVDFSVNTGLVRGLLLWLMLFHCLASTVMLKMVDGGAVPAGLGAFVILVWLSVLLAMLSEGVMSNVFHSTGGSS